MRFARILPCSFIPLVSAALLAELAKEPAKDKTADLARVAVMTFINESNNVDYEWVEKGLPDVINESMQARFEFVRQDENRATAIAAKTKHAGRKYQIADAAKIAKESQTDMLIYGNFRTNDKKDQLLFKAIIYNARGKK